MIANAPHASPDRIGNAPKGFFVVYVLAFVLILSVAVVARVFGLRWRSWFPGSEHDRSLIDGVNASVYTFMSFIV